MPPRPKNVLVTGAARRVGRAIALDFASRGAHVAVHCNASTREAAGTVKEIVGRGGEAIAVRADLTLLGDIKKMAEKVHRAFGKLDVLVASAAVFKKTPWKKVTEKDWDFHLDANLKSLFLIAKTFEPMMNDGGSIVTIGDWAAERPYGNFLPYCVSKAGVLAFTRALAVELAPRIRVNCISPGTVLPPENATHEVLASIKKRTPLGKVGSPHDVVAAVRFLVEETDFATGANIVIDGGRLIADPGYG